MQKKKSKKVYICQDCDYESPMWTGQCPQCREWNTLEESIYATGIKNFFKENSSSISENDIPKKLDEVYFTENFFIPTKIKEFDRVLGGGLIQGSLTLIGGEPGIGKSTLLTKIMGNLCNQKNYKSSWKNIS